jgi:hypothetical protein
MADFELYLVSFYESNTNQNQKSNMNRFDLKFVKLTVKNKKIAAELKQSKPLL